MQDDNKPNHFDLISQKFKLDARLNELNFSEIHKKNYQNVLKNRGKINTLN